MISVFQKAIEAAISKQPFGTQPASLYEPIRYIMSLGGKRLRPLLVLLAYSLYRNNASSLIRYAVAVEAFHNFTLLHDDIMDNAPLRRGKSTVHEKWNVNTAILSGDVMLVKVYEMFSGLEERKLKEVLKLFNSCAIDVCEGQQWDMEFETMPTVSEGQYLRMIRQKTAVLLGFSLELGAVLAGAPKQDRKALRDFGINIGIGFQLKDDLLDVYADAKKFGKQVGGDIIANKKTYLLIKALENAKGADRKELIHWLTAKKFNAKKKVKAVTSLYSRLGVVEMTERKIETYFTKAFRNLEKIKDTPSKKELIRFTEELIHRQH
jgi:geranylgeranyl diphosphate synthase, type II